MPARAEIAVLSGRGKTGRAVVSALNHAGANARALGRAEMVDLSAAVAGCDALYLMAPNMAAEEPAFVETVLATARRAGIRRVVYHSVTAPYAPAMPHHLGKAVAEDVVRRSGAKWTILQPCAYMQNPLPGLQGTDPAVEVAYDLDRPFGLVDLEDVAEAAATVLLREDDIGATYELGGPEAVSMRTVARTAEDLLSRPVRVQRLTDEQWASAAGADLDDRVRAWLLAMFAYYDRHGLPTGHRALEALIGRRPRSLSDVFRRELT